MNSLRRDVLKSALCWSTTAAMLVTGLFRPVLTWARNKPAFESKALADALGHIGATKLTPSKDIVIEAPDISDNAASVSVTVTSKIPNSESIAILVERNPFPLAAIFNLAAGGESYVSIRLKLAESTRVHAVVRAGDRFYSAAKEVKVTLGACA